MSLDGAAAVHDQFPRGAGTSRNQHHTNSTTFPWQYKGTTEYKQHPLAFDRTTGRKPAPPSLGRRASNICKKGSELKRAVRPPQKPNQSRAVLGLSFGKSNAMHRDFFTAPVSGVMSDDGSAHSWEYFNKKAVRGNLSHYNSSRDKFVQTSHINNLVASNRSIGHFRLHHR